MLRAIFIFVLSVYAAGLYAAPPNRDLLPPVAEAGKPPVAAADAIDLGRFGVQQWLQRMRQAGRQINYAGTYVVSAPGGDLSSARVWHAVESGIQVERIEALSGPQRSTFRRDGHVVTFFPESRTVKSERRDRVGAFSGFQDEPSAAVAEFYSVRVLGRERAAGMDSDVIQIAARDALRFGYRVWSERRTGLVVKVQTLDPEGAILEQGAFSELQLNAPVKPKALIQMMESTSGYRVENANVSRTTADAEGWRLRNALAGFKSVNVARRALSQIQGSDAARAAVQWTLSDGLATVSLFMEPYDPQRAQAQALLRMGATYTLLRRIPEGSGDWWLTAVGEVPPATLDFFARNLTRAK